MSSSSESHPLSGCGSRPRRHGGREWAKPEPTTTSAEQGVHLLCPDDEVELKVTKTMLPLML